MNDRIKKYSNYVIFILEQYYVIHIMILKKMLLYGFLFYLGYLCLFLLYSRLLKFLDITESPKNNFLIMINI